MRAQSQLTVRAGQLFAAVLLATGAGCQRASDSEIEASTAQGASPMEWAREALERNPHVEIVAVDSEAEVFTLRDKRRGELTAVKLSEIAAAPIAQLSVTAAPASAPVEPTTPEPSEPPPAATTAAAQSPAAAPPSEEPAFTSTTSSGYTIERNDGQVKVSGPGVSIVSSGAAPTRGDTSARQRSEPIICEGRRMLQLDSRDIYVEGDAITARGGCELYITNSRVAAAGIAVVVQDATVHISNSRIEGGAAAFSASDAAKMFVRSSTFQGVSRRGEKAIIQDQGGNRW